jgi:hypothetical protein
MEIPICIQGSHGHHYKQKSVDAMTARRQWRVTQHEPTRRRRQQQRAMATADTAATSGHVDDNDSNKQDGNDDDQDEEKADTMTTRQRATHQR